MTKTDNGQRTTYTYDALNRLETVEEPGGAVTKYTFDLNGNRMTKEVSHPAEDTYTFRQSGQDHTLSSLSHDFTAYTYDAANRLLEERAIIGGASQSYSGMIEAITRYEYDANGNTLKAKKTGQIDEEVVEYRYNEQGQLVEYINGANQATSYGYDGTGMRIAKTESGKTVSYYWDRGYIANECRPGEDTEPLYTSNYLEVDGIFARQQGESVQYLMKNGHGDVTAIVEDGAVAYVHTHGAVLPNTPRSSDKFLSSDDLAKIE